MKKTALTLLLLLCCLIALRVWRGRDYLKPGRPLTPAEQGEASLKRPSTPPVETAQELHREADQPATALPPDTPAAPASRFGTAKTAPVQPPLRNRTSLEPLDGLPYPVEITRREKQRADGSWEPVETLREIVADRVLINVPADTPLQKLEEAAAQIGGVIEKKISDRGLYRIRLSTVTGTGTVDRAAAALNARSDLILRAEADPIVHALAVHPNDPLYQSGELWGLNNTGQDDGTADADIDAPEAWALRTQATNIIVAIVDTGIRYTHEDLAANMWINQDETPGNRIDDDGNGVVDDVYGINALADSGDPMDDNNHGSHCAGTVGGVGNNSTGVCGVAWGVQLMACKFLGSTGSGATSDSIEAIDYAVAEGARILNNSWGGFTYSEALLDAIKAARDAGVIFVAAAGNSGTDNDSIPFYPTSYLVENIVSVAATDRNDELADFSNRGFGSVSIAGPGVDIISTTCPSNNAYNVFSGTSMATPHVSGALALVLAAFPGEPYTATINRLLNGGDALASLEGEVLTGRRLNLYGAITGGGNAQRPVNDDFADRLVLSEEVNYVRTTLSGATAEPAEPLHGGTATNSNSVWFEFTAQTDGQVSLYFQNSGIQPVVAVYTGSGLSALTPVALSTPESNASVFSGTAGTTYQIALCGTNNPSGLIVMTLSGPPGNNMFASARTLTGTEAHDVGTLVNASVESGEPDHAGTTGGHSVWWTWTAPVSMPIAVHTRQSTGENIDTLLAVYTAGGSPASVSNLTEVTSNDNEPGFVSSRVEFQALSGTTYYLAVDGKAGAVGTVGIHLVQPPANDHFSQAAPLLGGGPFSVSMNLKNGSIETGEPRHAGVLGGNSLWYRWTAPSNGTIEVDTIGSTCDTLLGIYTGTNVASLVEVASDDDSGISGSSRTLFEAVRNTTYFLAVDVVDTFLSFQAQLNARYVIVPENDGFASASELVGADTDAQGSLVGSSRESGEPADSGSPNLGASVWYRWTAPSSGAFGLYGDGEPGFGAVCTVYTGANVTALGQIAQDARSGVGLDSFTEWNATAGTVYHIQVTGWGQETGAFNLHLAPRDTFRPANDDFSNAQILDPDEVLHAVETQNYGATEESGEPVHAGMTARRTLWWRMTASENARYVMSLAGSDPDQNGIAVYTASGSPDVSQLTLVTDNSDLVLNTPRSDYYYTETVWTAQVATTYYIAVDTREPDGINMHGGALHVSFQRVPDQDHFAQAQVVSPTGGVFTACNFGASHESGEPNPAGDNGKKSLWWSFTPAASGRYRIDTMGSVRYGLYDSEQQVATGTTRFGMDTSLGIYTGSSVGALALVAENDSYSSESYDGIWSTEIRNSRLVVDLNAGTTYAIVVDGENIIIDNPEPGTTTGEIHLNVQLAPPPANDDFEHAQQITGSGFIQVITNNIGATKQSGEPNHGLTGGQSLWWRWTAPVSGLWAASSAGLLYDNDGVVDTGIGVYTGNSVNSLTAVGTNNDGAGLNSQCSALVTFNASAGVTYYLAIDSAAAGSIGAAQGNISMILTPVPANDNFSNAQTMTGTRWSTTAHNLGATYETGEPKIEWFYSMPNPTPNLKSVWWRWTASVSGLVTVGTRGSQCYTVMGVYTGSSVDSLTPIAEQRNSGDAKNGPYRHINGTSLLTFQATAGTTYFIGVQGAGYIEPTAGPLLMTLDGPPGPPAAPLNFTATRTDSNTVSLTWTDVATDEDTYRIERSLDSAAWTDLLQTSENAEEAYDYTVDPEVDLYYYRITGIGAGGTGTPVVVQTSLPPNPPAAPSALAASAAGRTAFLSWVDNSHQESAFVLERATNAASESAFAAMAQYAVNTTNALDSDLAPDTVYYYRVLATNAAGSSAPSPVAAVHTFAPTQLMSAAESTWYIGRTGLTPPATLSIDGNGDLDFFSGGSNPASDANTPLWCYFDAVTLSHGERLRLSTTLRFDSVPDNIGQAFTLGLAWSQGTKSLYNASGNNPPERRNDPAYGLALGLGGNSMTRYVYDPTNHITSTPWLYIDNSAHSMILGADPKTLTLNDTNQHSLVFDLALSNGTLQVEASIDGQLYDGGRYDEQPQTLTLDGVALVMRREAHRVFLSNLVVEHERAASLPADVVWRMDRLGTAASYGDAAPSANPDGDAFDNAEEYLSDTDPLDDASFFHINSLTVTGQQFRIQLDASTNRVYDLESCTNLPGTWAPVPGQTNRSGSTSLLLIGTNETSRAFYRVRVTIPDTP